MSTGDIHLASSGKVRDAFCDGDVDAQPLLLLTVRHHCSCWSLGCCLTPLLPSGGYTRADASATVCTTAGKSKSMWPVMHRSKAADTNMARTGSSAVTVLAKHNHNKTSQRASGGCGGSNKINTEATPPVTTLQQTHKTAVMNPATTMNF